MKLVFHQCFQTIVFIFIVIFTTFQAICPPAFFKCKPSRDINHSFKMIDKREQEKIRPGSCKEKTDTHRELETEKREQTHTQRTGDCKERRNTHMENWRLQRENEHTHGELEAANSQVQKKQFITKIIN